MDIAVGMNLQRRVKKSYEVREKWHRWEEEGSSITTGTMYITKVGGHWRDSERAQSYGELLYILISRFDRTASLAEYSKEAGLLKWVKQMIEGEVG
jgi:antibiotic biosynthesis monooxygenase (ABM) superfamily enzyme